ncbi:Radial Spoke Head Protein 4 A [Manis pentadactyla]|nr:Radial Spoke Head Protein 4 A [Manis pentadactyla]
MVRLSDAESEDASNWLKATQLSVHSSVCRAPSRHLTSLGPLVVIVTTIMVAIIVCGQGGRIVRPWNGNTAACEPYHVPVEQHVPQELGQARKQQEGWGPALHGPLELIHKPM